MTALNRSALILRTLLALGTAGVALAALARGPAETSKPPASIEARPAVKPIPTPKSGTAAKLVLRLQLAWGTDDDRPKDGQFAELDPALKERFRHLRWKHYFRVKEAVAKPLTATAQRVELSDKCAIEVADHGDGMVAISILNLRAGQGPSLVKTEYFSADKFRNGQVFAYAGESKDRWDDAWLAIITASP